ncbi:helix-turn-helix domain-containing protein [Paenibacillus sp. P26]|nr:helix-turn-helix domain-containing protein [Paenibacillus sp. P26]
MIRSIPSDETGTAFLMRDTGEWIVPPESRDEALSLPLKEAVLRRKGGTDSFVYRWNGADYMVSFGEVTKAGWLYVTAAPLSELTKPVLRTSRLILLSSMAGILAALALALFASRRLYQPIGRLVQLFHAGRPGQEGNVKHEIEFIEQQWSRLTRESRSLQENLKRSLPSLREGFLLQLVQGHLYAWDEAGLKQRMEQLGWDAADKQFVILLIQLSGLTEHGRFKEQDRQLISFAAANITEELAAPHLPGSSVINFQDLSVGLLCMLPREWKREELRPRLYGLAQELISALGKVLGLEVTVLISRSTDQAGDIPERLEQARHAARYRDMQAARQMIDMEEFVPRPRPVISYPFALEKEFLHLMRLGLAEEAYAKFGEFMLEIKRAGSREMAVQQALFQLMGSVRRMLIELGFIHHPLFTEGRLLEELIAVREPVALERWFAQRIMEPYLEQFGRMQNFHARQLVEQAMEPLQHHYHEDWSLEECAERLSASPYTLSRSFKQVAGVSYVDYIMGLRIDKAKEPLIGTQLKISEIAERVGYQHSYFNKIFKSADRFDTHAVPGTISQTGMRGAGT